MVCRPKSNHTRALSEWGKEEDKWRIMQTDCPPALAMHGWLRITVLSLRPESSFG